MPNYYYSPDGVNTVGPIDVNGLAALLRARTITRQTAAILEGQEQWATVGDYLPDTLRVGKPQGDRDADDDLLDDESVTIGRAKKANKRQSPIIAFALGFFFGPLGLLFVNWVGVVLWLAIFILLSFGTALISPGHSHPGLVPFIMLGGRNHWIQTQALNPSKWGASARNMGAVPSIDALEYATVSRSSLT